MAKRKFETVFKVKGVWWKVYKIGKHKWVAQSAYDSKYFNKRPKPNDVAD